MSDQSFPPKGYVPTRSAMEGVLVFMPAPQIDDYEHQVDFACPNCGGIQAYNVSDGGLSCTSCGYYQPPQGAKVGRRASTNEFITQESEQRKEERLKRQLGTSLATGATAVDVASQASTQGKADAELSAAETNALHAQASAIASQTMDGSPSSSDYDWGEERSELECNNCGASILLDPKSLTHVCPFCGSSSVIQHAFDHDKMRPRYLVPFKVETEPAMMQIREWLGSSWMTPSDLQKRAGLEDLTGIYLPYWTFTAVTSANWKAEVGHTRTRTRNGKTETYTVWKWESGSVRLNIRDLLVPGTAKLNRDLLDAVDQFDMSSLVEYEPSYLAGFNAQMYDIGLDDAWTSGREIMREQTKGACYQQASTNKIRNFSMGLDFADEQWRYVLLPVYLTTYRYENEAFSVMVNGQSGLIKGQRPIEWRKIGLAMGASIIPSIIIALTALLFFEGEQSQQVLIVAGAFAVLGAAISGWLVWTALNIRKAA
ncbi:MAG: hypothetical protein AAF846_02450 [Chloroflexota bacterium]